jgi:two-component system chemotaxis response regulator CheB
MLLKPESVEQRSLAPCRVLVVDDSAVVRGLLTRILRASDNCEVVASAGNGENAINTLRRHEVDVILLDIEMPVMDGLTAIPLLLAERPSVKIIMVSTLTTRNAESAMEAMRLGAHDYIAKPSSNRELSGGSDFAGDLIRKVCGLAATVRRPGGNAANAANVRARPRPVDLGAAPLNALRQAKNIVLRDTPIVTPSAIAIGSSTGGPKALTEMFANVDRSIAQPIFITQHMPPTFTAMLAQHLTKASGRTCCEGVHGMPVVPGNIYLAPGGFHMTVEGSAIAAKIALNQDPPENFCRPAVDPMLCGIAKVYGSRVLIVILTGMGSDGQHGCKAFAANGATIIAQDEASSTVWGMPGAVATAGLCNEILPLSQIGRRISEIASGTRL